MLHQHENVQRDPDVNESNFQYWWLQRWSLIHMNNLWAVSVVIIIILRKTQKTYQYFINKQLIHKRSLTSISVMIATELIAFVSLKLKDASGYFVPTKQRISAYQVPVLSVKKSRPINNTDFLFHMKASRRSGINKMRTYEIWNVIFDGMWSVLSFKTCSCWFSPLFQVALLHSALTVDLGVSPFFLSPCDVLRAVWLFCMILHYVLISLHSGQHWLQHQDGHSEGHRTAHKELFWSSPDESLQPDEKGLLPQVPPLWHLSGSHPEERPGGHHVSQKVTLLCVQRQGRGHKRTFGLVVIIGCLLTLSNRFL